jgi:hypothetical protein
MTPSQDPAAVAVTVTKEMVDKILDAVVDGTDLGAEARDFLRDNQDRLVGLSQASFKVLVHALQGAKTADDLYQAKTAYVQSLPYADLLTFQEASADALAKHANAQVRASTFFDAVAEAGTRIIPKLVPALLKFIL